MRRRPQQKGAGHGGSRAEDEVFSEAVRQPTTSFNDLKPFLVGSRIPFSALPAAFQKQRTAPARHEALSLGAGGPLRTLSPRMHHQGLPPGKLVCPVPGHALSPEDLPAVRLHRPDILPPGKVQGHVLCR